MELLSLDGDVYNSISIDQYKTDIGFKTLVEGVNEGLYTIPEYQRKFKWEWEQVEELAISLIRGLPIPPIYVWRNINTGDLEILDGQQRVMSLFFYYIGKWFEKKGKSCIDYRRIEIQNFDNFEKALSARVGLKDKKFTMKHNKQYYDISYNSLPDKIRKKVNYTTIAIIEIKISTANNVQDIIPKIFANLNAKGTLLERQEIRNGIYMCDFYRMLNNININNMKWRDLCGHSIDIEEKNMQCLVKMCAYKYFCKFSNNKFDIDKYSNNLQNFLDEFSELALTFDKDLINEYRTSIESFFEMFTFNTRVDSLPVFEGIFVVTDRLNIKKKITQEVYGNIKECVSDTLDQATAQRSRIVKRWNKIYEYLSKND